MEKVNEIILQFLSPEGREKHLQQIKLKEQWLSVKERHQLTRDINAGTCWRLAPHGKTFLNELIKFCKGNDYMRKKILANQQGGERILLIYFAKLLLEEGFRLYQILYENPPPELGDERKNLYELFRLGRKLKEGLMEELTDFLREI